jgi:hypothetical protein
VTFVFGPVFCFFLLHQIDENVQREIINHRSLRHPNIVRFKEVLSTHLRRIFLRILVKSKKKLLERKLQLGSPPPLWFVVDLNIRRTVNRLSHSFQPKKDFLDSLSLSLSCRFCSPPLTWLSLWSTQLEVRFLKGFAMLGASVRMRSVSLNIKSSLKKKDGLVWRM